MPIPLRCPRCNRKYHLQDELAGSTTRCECGIALTVPDPTAEPSAEALSDEESDEAQTARLREVWLEKRRRIRSVEARVGLIALIYGAVMATAFLAFEAYRLSQTGLGFWSIVIPWWLMRPCFTAGIAWGGVRMRKQDEHGLEYAGLCSGLLLLFPFWNLFAAGPSTVRMHGLYGYLVQVAVSVVVYCVPVYLIYWCWKLKTDRESLEEL